MVKAVVPIRIGGHVTVFVSAAESPQNESLSEAETKAKLYYISCLDANRTIQRLGARPLLDLIDERFTAWTVNWDVGSWNFQETLEHIHALGMSAFFSFWVAEDEKVPTQNILQVNFTLQFPLEEINMN